MKRFRMLLAAGIVVILAGGAWGQVTPVIHYQGFVTNTQGQPVTGSFQMKFELYDGETGGVKLWEETHSSVTLASGVFSVNLGSNIPLNESLFDQINRWLQTTIGAEVISPRTLLGATSRAFRVLTVNGASGGTISGPVGIANNATPTVSLLEISADASKATIKGMVPIQLVLSDGITNIESIHCALDGKVGIGTNPLAKLHVSSPSATQVRIEGTSPGLLLDPINENASNLNLSASSVPQEGVIADFFALTGAPTDRAFTIKTRAGVTETEALNIKYSGDANFKKDVVVDQKVIAQIMEILNQLAVGPGGVKFSDNTVQATAAGPGNFVSLQATTPGTPQTGNTNISGTGKFTECLTEQAALLNSTSGNQIRIEPVAGGWQISIPGSGNLYIPGISSDALINGLNYVKSTGLHVFEPTADVTGVTIRQTTAASPTADVFTVTNSAGTVDYLKVDALGTLDVKVPAFFEGPVTYALTVGCLSEVFSLPTTDVTGVTVRQTTATLPTSDVFKVTNPPGTVDYLKVKPNGETVLREAFVATGLRFPSICSFEELSNAITLGADATDAVNINGTTTCNAASTFNNTCTFSGLLDANNAHFVDVVIADECGTLGNSTWGDAPTDAIQCNGALTCNAASTFNNTCTVNSGGAKGIVINKPADPNVPHIEFQDGLGNNLGSFAYDPTGNATWTSSNTLVATVSNAAASRGLVTAMPPGFTGVAQSWEVGGTPVASMAANGQLNARYGAFTGGFVNTGTGGPPLNLTAGAPGGPGANLNLSSVSPVASLTGSLGINGDICWTGSSGVCSDRRYKINFRKISDALDKVQGLKGVYFNWRKDEFPEKRFAEGNQIGFVAQELKEVLPEAVAKDKDGYYMVDYGRITPLLVEALKEQQKQIEELKDRISELEQSRPQAKLEE